MKQLLLTLAAAAMSICASAATVVIPASSLTTVPGETTISGFTVDVQKSNGQTAPQVYQGKALRTYAKNTVTISGKNIYKVVFEIAESGVYRYTTFTPNVGSVGTQAPGDAEITWTGDEPSVTFTVGDKAIYGSDGEAKAGQIHIASITIEGDGDGSTPTDPTDPSEPTDPTEPADYYVVNTSDFTNPDLNTVEGFTFEAKTNGGSTAPALNNGNMRLYANNSLTITGDNLTKIEFILSKDASYRYTTVTPSTGAIAPEQVAGDTKFTWVGAASSVTIIVGEKATLGTDGETKSGQIRLSGFNIYGTPAEGGDTPVDPIEPTDDIYSGLVNSADDWTLDVDAQFPEGLNYVWSWKVYNNSGYLNASGYYQNAFEASAWAVSPVIDLDKRTDATLSFDHAAKFQTSLKELCGVYVKEATSENWEELVIPTWPEAGAWTFVNSGNIDLSDYLGKKIQIGFKYGSTASAADTWEIKNLFIKGETTSISDTIADENAPVEFFNLQGIRVANPENGIFIRRQGSNVSKVYVK